ncbi:MAG: thiol-disulfide isomerase/thioredoxin [Patiriisocius sp.]|jgi:thiol-disulfide isomerase/thioredoxin
MLIRNTITLYALLFTVLFGVKAEEVIIRGEAPDYAGKELVAFSYLDHFSKSLKIEGICIIDSLGNFELSFQNDKIQMINLRCDFVNAHIYVQPGTNYSVIFPPLHPGINKSVNNTAKVELFFNNLDEKDINSKLIDFNQRYAQFYKDNYDLLVRLSQSMGSRVSIDSDSTQSSIKSVSNIRIYEEKVKVFARDLDQLYNDVSKDFFFVYRKSVLADMLRQTIDLRQIYTSYIEPYEIDLHNPEQINLLQTFYDDYFQEFSSKFEHADIWGTLNNESNLETVLDTLQKDDFLKNITISEIVLAYSLYSEWDKNSIPQDRIIALLNDLEKVGSSSRARYLAQHLYSKLTRNMIGSEAYNFLLSDNSGQKHSLSDYRGKPVLLEFWATWCKSCLREMSVTNTLAEKYKNDFHFLSISIDENINSMKKHIDANPGLEQILLHISQDKLLMDQYQINSLPSYVLIDENGNLIDPNAALPSLVLEAKIHKIVSDRKKSIPDNFDPANKMKKK